MHYFYPQIFMIDFSADEYINFRNNLYLLIGINLIVSCYLNWKFQNSMKKVLAEQKVFSTNKIGAIAYLKKSEPIMAISLIFLILFVTLTGFENGSILLQALLFTIIICGLYKQYIVLSIWSKQVTLNSTTIQSAHFWLRTYYFTSDILKIPITLLCLDFFNYLPDMLL